MKIDKETFDKIAHLARLTFEKEEESKMMDEMTKIIEWVEKLEELDTNEVEPLMSMSQEFNALRNDDTGTHLEKEKALSNAPSRDKDYFRVPKVIE
ncbi:MAG: Asp-tRNA(Asn)/Glu-tRNA(Gln) amidotransferase subunit GatC [Cyclobacteriaceae bacterium]|nr:Asp-tRNA(Asn)/Glu-tRNA(Gln) amidotransferase subunit GatC [Cyclobacteriaceae bacterium]